VSLQYSKDRFPPTSKIVAGPRRCSDLGTRLLARKLAPRLLGPHWDLSRLDVVLLPIRVPRCGLVLVNEILCSNQGMSLALGRTWRRKPSIRPQMTSPSPRLVAVAYRSLRFQLFDVSLARKDAKTQAVKRIPKSMPRPPRSRLVPPMLDQAFIQSNRFITKLRDGHTKITSLELQEDVFSRPRLAALLKFSQLFLFCFAGCIYHIYHI
jgi:hypothetical protein